MDWEDEGGNVKNYGSIAASKAATEKPAPDAETFLDSINFKNQSKVRLVLQYEFS